MTVEQLKSEASKLSSEDRLDFAGWLASNDEVREARRERLCSEWQKGLERMCSAVK